MQAQIFPRGTYAPTMGVFTFAAQDPRTTSNNITNIFGAPGTGTTASTSSTLGKSKSKQPQYFSAYASMRAASPPTSTFSSSSHSDEDEALSEDEDVVPVESCNPATGSSKGKLSRAFKSLKKLGGK